MRSGNHEALLKTRKYAIAVGLPLIAMLTVGLIWELAVWAFELPSWFLPSPTLIIQKLSGAFSGLMLDTLITLQETLLGFLVATIIGFGMALVFVWSEPVKKAILPLLIFLQTMPKVAVAPLFVVWFGFGILPKVVMAFLICFFPIVINTAVGLASVDSEMLELITSMAAKKRDVFMKVRIPNALPYFFTSLKIAITLALIGAVVGEFVGGEGGLGYRIMLANGRLDAALVFSILVVLMFLGAGLFYLIAGLERLLLRWVPAGEDLGATVSTK